MALEAQSHRQRGAVVERRLRLAVERVAADAEVAGEVLVEAGVLARQGDILIEQIPARRPRSGIAEDAARGFRAQAHLGVERRSVAQVVVRVAVAPGVEAVMHPIHVVAVGDVGLRRADVRLRRDAAALPVELRRRVVGLLLIVAGLVRKRGANVVQRERVVAVVGFQHASGDVQFRSGREVEGEARTDGHLVDVVRVLAAKMRVLDEAVAAIDATRDPPTGAIGQRPRGCHADADAAVVAHVRRDLAFAGLRRRPGDHVDEAGQRVGAVQRALRPAQHFHLLDIEQPRDGADAGQIDAIDEQAHRGVQRLLELAAFANAAQLQKARPRCALGEVQVGDGVEHVVQVLGLAPGDGVGIEHGHARRHARKVRIAQGGGDDDLFDDLVCAARLIARRLGAGCECHGHASSRREQWE